MTLVCPGNDGPLPEAALGALLAALAPGRTLRRAAAIEAALEGEGPIVVALRDPVSALAWRLDRGAEPQAALDDWAEGLRTLLAHQRRARRRITLLDPRLVAAPDPEALALLATRLGAPPPDQPVAPAPDDFPALSALLTLMAAAHLSVPEARALADEIETATLGAPGLADPRPDVSGAWAEWTRLRAEAEQRGAELARQTAELAQRSEEAGLLRQNVALQLEAAAQVRGEAERLRAEVARHTADVARRDEEAQLLRENLALQLEVAEQSRGEAERLRAEMARQAAELAQRGEEAELLRQNAARQSEATGQSQAEAERLRAELARRDEDAQRLRQDIAARTEAAAQARSEAEHLRAEVARQSAELNRRDEEVGLLRENVALQLEATAQLQAEAERLRADLARQDDERRQASDATRKSLAEHHLLTATRTALERRLEQAQRQQALREAVLVEQILDDGAAGTAAAQEIDRLQTQVQTLEARLDEVYRSRSWRVTSPLRAISSRVR